MQPWTGRAKGQKGTSSLNSIDKQFLIAAAFEMQTYAYASFR